KIDIAQATGRAMRKPSGSDKEVGYVVVPLFLDRTSGETLEEALERSDFADVIDVLNAMREQDEVLVQIIQELQEAKGREEIFDLKILSEKVEVLGPSIELSALRSEIFAEIVDAIGLSWDEWYGRLTLYKNREGHCSVPRDYEESGFRLGGWVNNQRHAKNTMPVERRQRLDKLGFIWDSFEADWAEGFSCLKIYKEREGHCRVSQRYIQNGYHLGQWVQVQRKAKVGMSAERREQLDELGFVWDPFDADWDEGFHYLTKYKMRTGHCNVPALHKEEGYRLGGWVRSQRRYPQKVSKERLERLKDIGFVWNQLDANWDEAFQHLKI